MRNPLGLGALTNFRRRLAAVRSFLARIICVDPVSVRLYRKRSPASDGSDGLAEGGRWKHYIQPGYQVGGRMAMGNESRPKTSSIPTSPSVRYDILSRIIGRVEPA